MSGCVYIALSNRVGLKIGQTRNPKQRLYNLRSTERFPVEMVYKHPSNHQKFLEYWTHLFLRPFHIRGDWFDVSVDLARASIEMMSPRVDAHKVLMAKRDELYTMPYGEARTVAFNKSNQEIDANKAPIDAFRGMDDVTEQDVLNWIERNAK